MQNSAQSSRIIRFSSHQSWLRYTAAVNAIKSAVRNETAGQNMQQLEAELLQQQQTKR